MKILVTGVAGFIGFSFANYLCKKYKNINIIGVDNLNSYYSTTYKKRRINELVKNNNFIFKKIDLVNYKSLDKIFKKNKFYCVYNFAAQAGVRHSIKEPRNYINNNIVGFFNILELIKKYKINKLFYASSSSVYGEKKVFPTSENDSLNPTNVYSLSKNFNEKIVNIYCNIHKIKAVGLRFFTVYGKWGRPDMFLFRIFYSILNKKTFELNNSGNHKRDFTYIEDVNKILDRLLNKKINKQHTILNICSGKTENILRILNILKKENFFKVKKISRNAADLLKTHGSNKKLLKFVGKYKFKKIDEVINEIFNWYKLNNISKLVKK